MLSRVAESLYWMGRYIERAENIARILDVNLQVTLDTEVSGDESEARAWQPIIATFEDQKLFDSLYAVTNGDAVCEFVTFAKENPNSIFSCVSSARENARTVREYISSEMWERINGLYLWVRSVEARDQQANSGIDFYRQVVDFAHQFHGTTDSTLNRGEGWNFLQFGKFIERADSTSRILDLKYHILLPKGEQVGGNIDIIQWQAVLKSCSAFEAFRKARTAQVTPSNVSEFIILDGAFPRSIRFCVNAMDEALHSISGCSRAHYSNESERLAGRLVSDLTYSRITDIIQQGLHEYLEQIQVRLFQIGNALQTQYCEWIEPKIGETAETRNEAGSQVQTTERMTQRQSAG
ncbi:MAG: alpha-E domain-containing protein [Chthoniobacteraceae bacterium]